MKILKVDHLKLIQRDPKELKKMRSVMVHGGVGSLAVEHEADGSCCQQEPWALTAGEIIWGADTPPPEEEE